jgi:hypothetical protein
MSGPADQHREKFRDGDLCTLHLQGEEIAACGRDGACAVEASTPTEQQAGDWS